jgi:hypothetical protein
MPLDGARCEITHQPEHFTLKGVKCSPCRAGLVGANRDKAALRAAQADISPKAFFMNVKYPG